MAIKVLHVGLGPIGAGVVRQVAERKGLKIVPRADEYTLATGVTPQ